MKTNIRFPKVSYPRREHFAMHRCAWLCDSDVQKAVIEGRFVLAWDGDLDEGQPPTLGVLESVSMNSDGGRTYTITSEHGTEHIPYQNANVIMEEWCPEVVLVDKYGQHRIHRWIGLQEQKDGKVYAMVTNSGNDTSTGVDPSKLILLDDCKVGLPEREET